LAIPDAAGAVTSEISLSKTGISHLEFVEVNVTSDHTQVGDLRIALTSPSKTVSTLAVPHECKSSEDGPTVNCGSGLSGGFRFGVARLVGEVADGKWTLTVQDTKATGTGSLLAWNIKAMGY
jgi:kexin